MKVKTFWQNLFVTKSQNARKIDVSTLLVPSSAIKEKFILR